MGAKNAALPRSSCRGFLCVPLSGWLTIDRIGRPRSVRVSPFLCAAPGWYARMDDFVLILVFHPFSSWYGRIGPGAVGEASWVWIVGKIHLLLCQRYDFPVVAGAVGCLGASDWSSNTLPVRGLHIQFPLCPSPCLPVCERYFP